MWEKLTQFSSEIDLLLEELNLKPDENWLIIIKRRCKNKKDLYINIYKSHENNVIRFLKSKTVQKILESQNKILWKENKKRNKKAKSWEWKKYLYNIKNEIDVLLKENPNSSKEELILEWKKILQKKLIWDKLNQAVLSISSYVTHLLSKKVEK